jgi:antitoxin ParD1/3/4
MNFSLGKKLESYVAEQVSSGMFNNASEVVRDALRLHEERQLRLDELRRGIRVGLDDVAAGRYRAVGPDEFIVKPRPRAK